MQRCGVRPQLWMWVPLHSREFNIKYQIQNTMTSRERRKEREIVEERKRFKA